MERNKKISFFFAILFLPLVAIFAQEIWELNVHKKGVPVQSTMYGLFFEDINFAADGGLYAEMIKNRSFDFPQNLMGWSTFGNVEVKKENPQFKNNPTYLQLAAPSHISKYTGIENEGFRGMGFKKDEKYSFSVWAKNNAGRKQKIRIELISSQNHVIGRQELDIEDAIWTRYEAEIIAQATESKGRLRIFFLSEGSILVDHVSLFPEKTWKGRKNGLRQDIAQALYDLKPGVFRFPGGCIVEGTELGDRYDWKKSIGPVEERPLNLNRWQYTFPNRFFPDYYQSYGLGFYEYFLLAEDMGAQPLPIVNVGLVCQYQNPDEEAHVALTDLDPYIQDALDLIEFANGDATTYWGKKRIELGHPEPFNMRHIGIGNEQWGKMYVDRLELFNKAIRKKHPEIKIIGSSGPYASGKDFDYLWPEMKKAKVDLVDEHYYQSPEWFLGNATRYDSYDRKGPAVFAGEYACHMPDKANSFASALYEAAFMTGLERNADIVHMSTYAPLLAHVDGWQWRPDMIWFDNLSLVKTPNYYVQQIFATNKGSYTLPLTMNNKPIVGQDNIYASAVYDESQRCYIVKTVNVGNTSRKVNIHLSGGNKMMKLGECIKFHSKDLNVANEIGKTLLKPCKGEAVLEGGNLLITLDQYSLGVYKVCL